ncbi:hypothetical protein CPAST_c24980 [Clostridium pasteurianum DSM 525 = ATCC 6013]|uniref:ABC-2 family transporter protein n=1 Tax=Clostridium pasteurianum DSM 525 = ATCC 6013 TaxID=1262449 RepID=A0A0H3J5T9_CLOPA|nr:hypothetical protein [Clostridium pasteurianum]AJA48567.1 hypothetical protein CPAST_c24980 [Clostridium pasteurianum DSM 525 = ATCC 6013]AJA52555.1 hypothetical protein CLPA_c24980 [Clostridium pasteurianum DSM 525 = ATCC 6013]AOZ75799.1 hypothetical protein AQ983_12135 [Clostridium pasteurianum DSM 525 = ATCC 6013]AOZ79595.1 hypothetical protein AQ984_12130 [Clostridium pasteurianum]ELP57954.1 hypothetical protein F502_17175 [Clostridium pasteurianum DSM 525 = ATCC 6013]
MANLQKTFFISINNIRKWASNPRIYILAALLFLMLWNYVNPILSFSKIVNYRVAPWLFPYISNWYFTQMLMMLGIVFLFCDAPFMDECQTYLMVRSGRIPWGAGQVLYIMLGTAIYFLFIVIISILILSPSLFLSNGWGKVLGTLAQTNAGQKYGILLPISYNIQLQYTPIEALLLSFLLQWCAGTMVGLVMFIINIYLKRSIGAIVGSSIVLFDFVVANSLPYYYYHFSPSSMARLTILDPTGMSPRPTNLYAYIFFIIGIIVLSVISVISVRKRQIEVLPPV